MGTAVFISYARNDDLKPPFDDATHGWVTFFWHQLRFELTNSGLPEANLWLDRFEIEPTEEFTPKIEAALRDAELIIPVLSENWIKRDWTRPGTGEVSGARTPPPTTASCSCSRTNPNPSRARPRSRAAKATASSSASRPARCASSTGAACKTRRRTTPSSRRSPGWIADRLLRSASSQPHVTTPAKNRTVYVAVAADELGDARQRLVNDLTAAGYTVVPAKDRLPDTLAAAEAEVGAALAAAELAVLILGENDGVIPGRRAGGDRAAPASPCPRARRATGALGAEVAAGPPGGQARPVRRGRPLRRAAGRARRSMARRSPTCRSGCAAGSTARTGLPRPRRRSSWSPRRRTRTTSWR